MEERDGGRLVGDTMLRLAPSPSTSWTPSSQWQATLGYAFHPDVHGRGYATEVGRELLAIAFRDLGLRRVDADAYAENGASNRVLERIGMTIEGTVRAESLGKDGRWLDANLWGILREEWVG